MKMKQKLAVVLTAALMIVTMAGCGMNKEKAIEQMEQALRTGYDLQSGKMSAQMSAEVALGADTIPMELTMEGSFKDQLQTMAMKTSGEIMGMPIDTETYQLDGYSYTLDTESGKYIKMPSATAGIDYQKLMTLGQEEMVDLYVQGAQADENFAFTEEEKGLRVQFTMPAEQLVGMKDAMSSMMIDELLPTMEQQLRENVQSQMDTVLAMLPEEQTIDQEQLDALIDQQIAAIVEMEKQLFQTLEIGALSCDLLIEDGVINDQSIQMELSFNLKGLVEALGVTDTTQVPETCTMKMDIHSLIENRNEDIQIEMPDLSDANILGE